jgi:hypothetical protein
MNRFLVITTINSPSASLRRHAETAQGWDIVVVADKKTPASWDLPGTYFLSVDEQLASMGAFAAGLPFNHYGRKNLGYLYAIRNAAGVIAETDDDNEPLPSFLKDCGRFVKARRVAKTGWENIYTHFTAKRVWPRGFPLEFINASFLGRSRLTEEIERDCPVQQFLANGDPDVDAVYRLTVQAPVTFDSNRVSIAQGTYCPFNSQNTVWWPDAFPLLYLPSFVSFRMTDIWRSFVAQICLFALGKEIFFGPATVSQARNEHSLMRDFRDEIDGYMNNAKIMGILSGLPLSVRLEDTGKNMMACYEALVSNGIIPKEELALVELWMRAINEKH